MTKPKQRSLLFKVVLVISWLAALTYLSFLFPSFIRQTYGPIPDSAFVYWICSGIIYVIALAGVTAWKRQAAYYVLGVLILDALAAAVLLSSAHDTVMNLALAALWAIVFRKHWQYFS